MPIRKFPKEDKIKRFIEKPKVQSKIICRHCGKFSGWENWELSKILRSADLKCQECGKVFMSVKINNFRTPAVETTEDDFVQNKGKKPTIQEQINNDENGNTKTEGSLFD